MLTSPRHRAHLNLSFGFDDIGFLKSIKVQPEATTKVAAAKLAVADVDVPHVVEQVVVGLGSVFTACSNEKEDQSFKGWKFPKGCIEPFNLIVPK